ncbi:MAG: SDR family oxidoreductase, partial [Halobacteria archaeon]|nr:SDR family oxidoreductase [Halobacteria archaeon]
NFHERGWEVYATARTPSDIDDLADQGMETLELDVTVDEDCVDAVETVVEEEGGIGCLVNNAGYGEMGTVEDLGVENFHAQLDVNTYGPYRLMRASFPHMRNQGDGTVINMSSVGGQLAQPGLAAYCASKFALEALSDSARAEVKRFGVDVVLIEPGPVQTQFTEKAEDSISEHSDGGPYQDLYERIEEFNDSIGDREGSDLMTGLMGKITVSPDRVAEVIVEAAEDSNPKPRYKVSVPHRIMGMGRFVPDRVRDWAFNQTF